MPEGSAIKASKATDGFSDLLQANLPESGTFEGEYLSRIASLWAVAQRDGGRIGFRRQVLYDLRQNGREFSFWLKIEPKLTISALETEYHGLRRLKWR